jgi:hypothetical protein
MGEKGAGFGAREDDGQFGRATDALDPGNVFELSIENLLVEKKKGAEGLILSGCSDAAFDGKMAQEQGNLGFAHLLRMPFAVEEDEASDPINVSLLGAEAVMPGAQMPADAIE